MSATIVVNGRPLALPSGATEPTVAVVVALLLADPTASGVAVAVEGEVVPRSQWADRSLGTGDRVEVVTAVPGG